MMNRALLVAGFLLAVGCQGVVGPRQRLEQAAQLYDPCLTISEKEQRQRALLALPEKSPEVAPRTGAEEPSYRRGW
jgi:hypothetical protein